jgi:probable F420-dependent oxidoreductase
MTPPQGFRAGFAVPQVFPDGHIDLETTVRIAQRAEALGYDSLWVQEQSLNMSRTLEPVALLSYLAALVPRVRLGVAVFVLPHHQPDRLAAQLATLDVLSRGRLTVGVGLGAPGPSDAAFGAEGPRVRRFPEVLRAMDVLWREDEPRFEGEFFRVEGVSLEPKPVQKPRPPVWFGARAERAIRRAVRYGDGWIAPGSSSSEEFRQHIVWLRQALADAGRDPSTFPVSKRVYVAIDDDPERARSRLEAWFAHHYREPEMATRVSIWGRAEECYERIDELIDAGAQHLLLNPIFDYDAHLEALARYTGVDT